MPELLGDRVTERFALYRQIIELEQDQVAGKIAAEDLEALRADLLASAAALMGGPTANDASIEEEIEREIAAARARAKASLRESTA
jgi:hypothetical protein